MTPAEPTSPPVPPRLVCLFLVLAVWLVYLPVRRYEFVNLDDNQYVYEHPVVSRGLTWGGVKWAFQADLAFETEYADYWMPLVILSRMLDVELFGLNAGGHHAVNVLFHSLNAVLVFLLWLRLTGRTGPSAFVGALFALHPIHVESVAWVSERKDCLSACLALLTLLLYARYGARPSRRRYGLVFVPFVLGLMAKPLAVTIPGIMLLLDVWPLGRLAPTWPRGRESWRRATRRLAEKAPFVVLAAGAVAITLRAQRLGGAFASSRSGLTWDTLANALGSYAAYAGKAIVPVRLAVMYPWTQALPLWQVGAGVVLLVGGTFLAVRQLDRRPYLFVGWFWYVGTLLPFIGVLQFGPQRMADRFAYIPLIGLYTAFTWWVADVCAGSRRGGRILRCGAALILPALALRSMQQVRHWQDSVTLFEHALRVTRNNALAHNNLAVALQRRGRYGEAVAHYQAALRIRPRYREALVSLGGLRLLLGDLPAATARLGSAVALAPRSIEARMNLGNALLAGRNLAGAEEQFRAVLDILPTLAEAHRRLAAVLALKNRPAEAREHMRRAQALEPIHDPRPPPAPGRG